MSNSSSRKITEVKQLAATESTWMGDHSSVEVDALCQKYYKIPGAEKRGL